MKKKRIIPLLCIVLLAGIYILCVSKETSKYEVEVNKITKMSNANQQEMIDNIVEKGKVNINYQTDTIFKGTVSESFNVKNNPNNQGALKFELIDKMGDVLYQSKMIRPGYEINKIKLEKSLPKGIHECIIKLGCEEGTISSLFPITIRVR